MSEPQDLLARVRIASPCPASWSGMEGDERVRFCRLCNLNVYNLSGMMREEAAALVAGAEGRLCARLYRRADGKVLTRDCPTGLRAVRRRARRTAAAVLASVASLWSLASGQASSTRGGQGKEAALSCKGGGQLKLKRRAPAAGEQESLSGVILDPLGAVIPGVRVTLKNEATKEEAAADTDDAGRFSFARPAPGAYTLTATFPGFSTQQVKKLPVRAGESLGVELVLSLDGTQEIVGVLVVDQDWKNADGKTVFGPREITGLPY
jgi:hypothetical protein